MKSVTGSLERFNLIFKYRILVSDIKFCGKVFKTASVTTPHIPEVAGEECE